MFRTRTLLSLLTLPLLAACEAATAPTEPAYVPAAQFAAGPVPMHGRCTITSTQVVSFQPPVMHQRSTATCNVSHLGRITIVNEQEINVATGVQIGDAIHTTPTGELLYVTSLGTATQSGSTTLDFTGHATITGGTGRFAGASGMLEVVGSTDIVSGTGEFTYEGWLDYQASARAGR